MGKLLIGSYAAKLDKSGRIKIPEKFRAVIEEEYGKELFITSLTEDSCQIYPLSVWQKLTGIASEGAVHLKPLVRNFMIRVNRLGNKYEIDSKGRVLISQAIRDKAQLEEEVEVIGLSNHLEVWNKKSLDDKLKEKPLTDEDFEIISELEVKGNPK
ncbi:MAG: division/cell wall cluster transcriptional repressor MraZ [Candidatus Aminicenantaceae bacterium]